MFSIELTYQVPFSEIEPYLADHLAFVDQGFASGHFLASGRKVPRTGGLIFCRAADQAEVTALMQADPFVSQKLVELRIVEFAASRTTEGFTGLLDS